MSLGDPLPYRDEWRSLSPWFGRADFFGSSIFDVFASGINREFSSYARRFTLDESEDGKTATLALEIPGFKSSEVAIDVQDDTITVRAARGDNVIEQSINIGHEYDTNAAEAKLEDGILAISLKRLQEAQPRRIEIKESSVS